MQKQTLIKPTHRDKRLANTPSVGLPVRTNLRAGLALDNLDDQAKALWNNLTGAVSSTVDAVKASVTPTQS